MALFPIRPNPRWKPRHDNDMIEQREQQIIDKSREMLPFAKLLWRLFLF